MGVVATLVAPSLDKHHALRAADLLEGFDRLGPWFAPAC